jgi:Domain of unknown function (DUF5122) beta-propeller
MPNSLDVVLMQVAYERRVVAIGVLRPHAGLAARRGSVREGGREERIDRIAVLGGEGNMRRRGHGQPAADREVVLSLRPITEAVVLNIKFLIAEWSEGGCIEPPARVEVRHDEEHVVDDDAASNHAPGLYQRLTASLGCYRARRYNTDGSLDESFGGDGKVPTDFTDGYEAAYGVAIQADGKIVAAGPSGCR